MIRPMKAKSVNLLIDYLELLQELDNTADLRQKDAFLWKEIYFLREMHFSVLERGTNAIWQIHKQILS